MKWNSIFLTSVIFSLQKTMVLLLFQPRNARQGSVVIERSWDRHDEFGAMLFILDA
jgi:hypothetical protein